jgi:hypothetical protein
LLGNDEYEVKIVSNWRRLALYLKQLLLLYPVIIDIIFDLDMIDLSKRRRLYVQEIMSTGS